MGIKNSEMMTCQCNCVFPAGGERVRSTPATHVEELAEEFRVTRRTHRRNIDEPGHAHELTFSCYHGHPFLASNRTCQWLADAIDRARELLSFDLWAYVFMPNHAHLIIRPWGKQSSIAEIRKAIKSPVAKLAIQHMEQQAPEWLPRIARTRGSKQERLFWQSGGGYDRNVTDGDTLLSMIEYIHLNPVRRSLATSAIDWKWSSATALIQRTDGPIRLDPIPSDWLS